MGELCQGKIPLSKKLKLEGVDDSCAAWAFRYCPDCGKRLCHNHILDGKHECVHSKEYLGLGG